MLIKYKTISHERKEDAPFIGALISAVDCKFKCKGCCNRSWKKEPTLSATAESIVWSIKLNKFNEGIIFGGLEWSLQPMELLELSKEASAQGLKIMIYTGCETLEEFYFALGKAIVQAKPSKGIMITQDLYAVIGKTTLDLYIPEDYYIKIGKYDNTKLAVDRVHFGVKLASENQNICLIKSE